MTVPLPGVSGEGANDNSRFKAAKQKLTLGIAPGASMPTKLKLNAKIVAAVKKAK